MYLVLEIFSLYSRKCSYIPTLTRAISIGILVLFMCLKSNPCLNDFEVKEMIKDVNNWFIVVIFYPFPICSLEHDINHFTDTNNGAISVQMDIYIYIIVLRSSL